MTARVDVIERLLAVAAAAAAVALLLWAARLVGVGLDFSDDGYYLNINRNPGLYSYSATQFGFIYNPFFRALGWDVALFRQSGLVATSLLSGILAASWLRRAGFAWLWGGLIGLVVAPVSLTLLYMWLPTPGYNSLGFQGLLLVGIALSIIDANGRAALAGWALLGIGGWLVFMAKPTSAALLGPLVLGYLLAARSLRMGGVLIAVVVAAGLLVASALAIDGGIGGFVRRLSLGSEFAAALEGGHTLAGILRLDLFSLSRSEAVALAVNTALIAAATFCAGAAAPHMRIVGLAIVAVYILAALGVAMGWIVPPFGFGTYIVLQIWAAPLGAIAGMAMSRSAAFHPPGRLILLAVLFALFPHVLSFGTNNNYWSNGAMAGLFWVLAGLLPVAVAGWRRALPGAVGAMGIVAIIMASSTQQPYRQTQALPQQHTAVAFGPGSKLLPMSDDFALYIEGLRALAQRGGFVAGTPVIDLTGHYPGALFALDAAAIGQAWMIGGYSGSDAAARAALALVPCDLIASAWLLREPDGERALSFAAILPSGLEFEDVGSIMSPTGTYPQAYRQWLSRPIGNPRQRQSICEAAR